MNSFYSIMVSIGRYDLMDVPEHCRVQVATMLGREDELNPSQPDPVQEQEPAPGEDPIEDGDPEESETEA
ncbi:hypothetical protein NSQ54_10335 [Alkalihalobacillus sp. FSL W8-0930]